MSVPTVSVIIPTYNRANTLQRAIDSVRAQSFEDWELVIVDDGSTDGTPDLLSEYADRLGERLTILRQSNRGCSAARNRGIDYARGRFVAFLDSDDEFMPTKLGRQMQLFAGCPNLDFVYSDYSFVDLQGVRSPSAFSAKFPIAREFKAYPVGDRLNAAGPDLFCMLLRGYFIATIVGMVRRESLGRIRFDERISYSEEWLFFLQLARTGQGGFVDEPLSMHHFTEGSLTRSSKVRNLVRQCELFHAMAKLFPDLEDGEAATIAYHLAKSHAQLARHFQTSGHPAKALLHSAQSYYYRQKAGRVANQVAVPTAR